MEKSVQLGLKQYGLIGLTVATAIIHLFIGVTNLPNGGVLFVLNGIGYLALVAGLYFVPQLAGQRSMVRWVLIGFAALTIILYFVINDDPLGSILGLITKVIELVLIVLLWIDK